ncbi:MAG: hypothetical protein ACR2NF_05225 [Pirellulales bacterium]
MGDAFLRTITSELYEQPVFAKKEDCYEQGQASASQGVRRESNPYPDGTQQREWWDGGYCDDYDEISPQ